MYIHGYIQQMKCKYWNKNSHRIFFWFFFFFSILYQLDPLSLQYACRSFQEVSWPLLATMSCNYSVCLQALGRSFIFALHGMWSNTLHNTPVPHPQTHNTQTAIVSSNSPNLDLYSDSYCQQMLSGIVGLQFQHVWMMPNQCIALLFCWDWGQGTETV